MAAALCAEGEGPPPPDLQANWDLERYRIPPRSGGQDMQPAGMLARMTAAANVYNAWYGLLHATHKVTWQSNNPEAWEICKTVFRLRKAEQWLNEA